MVRVQRLCQLNDSLLHLFALSPQRRNRRKAMSRFKKLSHTLWYCQYHIVWVPKYRFRILTGKVATEVERCIRAFSEQKKCEVVELNVQVDHIHLLAKVSPKISISDYVGILKGRTAIRVSNKFKELKQRPYWGNHF